MKLKAFTLIESIVSLTLISVTVGTCFLLFNQTAINGYARQEARAMADTYFIELEGGLLDSEQAFFDKNGLEMNVQVTNYGQVDNLYLVRVRINKEEKELYRVQKLMVLDED